jgi:hypothetical protein
MRKNKDGTKHAHTMNTQDLPHLNLSPTERALWKFRNVAELFPRRGDPSFDLLPPAARMAVDAVAAVLDTLEHKE